MAGDILWQPTEKYRKSSKMFEFLSRCLKNIICPIMNIIQSTNGALNTPNISGLKSGIIHKSGIQNLIMKF